MPAPRGSQHAAKPDHLRKDSTVILKTTEDQKARYWQAADLARLGLSEWIRTVLDQVAAVAIDTDARKEAERAEYLENGPAYLPKRRIEP